MSTTNCTPDAVGGANCTTITTPDMSQEPAEADRGHCALCNLISIFQGDAKKRHARAVGKMLAEGNCVGAEQYALEKGDLDLADKVKDFCDKSSATPASHRQQQ